VFARWGMADGALPSQQDLGPTDIHTIHVTRVHHRPGMNLSLVYYVQEKSTNPPRASRTSHGREEGNTGPSPTISMPASSYAWNQHPSKSYCAAPHNIMIMFL
jgi:hypothetical protein